MKQLSQQVSKILLLTKRNCALLCKVSLILMVLTSSTYTGFLKTVDESLSFTDMTTEASANGQTYKYVLENLDDRKWWDDVQYTFPNNKGDKIEFTVDFSNNTFTTTKTGWGFQQESFDSSGQYFLATSNYEMFSDGRGWIHKLIKGSSSQLSYNKGINYFTSLSAGETIYLVDKAYGYYDSGHRNELALGFRARVVSKTLQSGGGSCGGGGGSSQKYKFVLENLDNRSWWDDVKYTFPFNKGDKIDFTVDFSNNTFTTSKTGWGFQEESRDSSTERYLSTNSYEMFNDGRGWIHKLINTTSAQINYNKGLPFFQGLTTGQTLFLIDKGNGYNDNGYPRQVGLGFQAKILSKTQDTGSSGGCSSPAPTPPAPTPTTVYPRTCASGLTPKGTPGTSNFYCEKPVKVTEKEYVGANDINLENIMGEFGSTGEREDGQFNLDSGNHNNGWHLNGNGEAYKSNHIQFTNIPDNGYVNAIGDSWQPEYLITQGKLKIEVPKSPSSTAVEQQKRDTDLNTFKSTKSLSEVITYEVTDLNKLKEIKESTQGLADLFTKSGSTYKHGTGITSHVVNSSGEGNYNTFKINKSGYYIIASKYTDMVSATKEQATPTQATIMKHTYYNFVPVSVNFMTDLGYLPIYNNLMTQINDSILTVGNKKANHKMPNLKYGTYKSLKAPSSYNHTSGKTVIGSTSGGLQLLGKDLSPVAVSSTTDVANIKVTDVVEHGKGFYISSDKGILYLNCESNELVSTSVTTPVNDLEVSYDTMYYLTDNKLFTMFLADGELVTSNREYDLASMFKSPTTKAGRVEVIGDLITISSKDDSIESEVITLSK